jgi:hypothetical protein
MFRPPDSNTLRSVRAVVLFALDRSRRTNGRERELGPRSLWCWSQV